MCSPAEYGCFCLCRDADLLDNARLVVICCSCREVFHAVDCADNDSSDCRPECANHLDFRRNDSLLDHFRHLASP